MPSSRASSQHRDGTQVSCITSRFFAIWAIREAQEYWSEDCCCCFCCCCSVTQLCPTLQPHGLQHIKLPCPSPAPRLEWVAYPFSRGSSWLRNPTGVSCIAGGFFTNWAIREVLNNGCKKIIKYNLALKEFEIQIFLDIHLLYSDTRIRWILLYDS